MLKQVEQSGLRRNLIKFMPVSISGCKIDLLKVPVFFQLPEPSKWEKSSGTEEDTIEEDLRQILKAKSSLMFSKPTKSAPKPESRKPEPEPKPESRKPEPKNESRKVESKPELQKPESISEPRKP